MSEKQFTFNKDTVATNLKTPITYNNKTMSIGEVLEKLNELADENKELKSFKDNVFNLLDKKLEEYPYLTLSEKWDNNCKYKHSCRENHEKNVAYASINTTLNKLKKELKND